VGGHNATAYALDDPYPHSMVEYLYLERMWEDNEEPVRPKQWFDWVVVHKVLDGQTPPRPLTTAERKYCIIVMHWHQRLSGVEIAAILGISTSTPTMYLKRYGVTLARPASAPSGWTELLPYARAKRRRRSKEARSSAA